MENKFSLSSINASDLVRRIEMLSENPFLLKITKEYCKSKNITILTCEEVPLNELRHFLIAEYRFHITESIVTQLKDSNSILNIIAAEIISSINLKYQIDYLSHEWNVRGVLLDDVSAMITIILYR